MIHYHLIALFTYVRSQRQLERYKERVRSKKRCLENSRMKAAAEVLLIEMSSVELLLSTSTY